MFLGSDKSRVLGCFDIYFWDKIVKECEFVINMVILVFCLRYLEKLVV